jgi:hypothetical protein
LLFISEDDNTSKDNNSEDDGNNGKDDNNNGGNDNSGGGGSGKIGGEVGGVSRSVGWLVAVFFAVGCLTLTYRRNCTDTFGNKFILINSIQHVQTCQIEFVLFVHLRGLGKT